MYTSYDMYTSNGATWRNTLEQGHTMIIHIIRRDAPLGFAPQVYKQAGVFYAIVVHGKLSQIIGDMQAKVVFPNDAIC